MFLERIRMDGKVALVVGAGGGGHGTNTSLALAEAGATIVAFDLTDERISEIQAQVEDLGQTCIGIRVDVLDTAALKAAVATAIERAGRIDYLVNVVGAIHPGQFNRIDEYPVEVFDDVIALNLRYVFVVCGEVARHMIEQGIKGSIVNFSSISAHSAAMHSPYGASKIAIEGLSRSMATEWGEFGIRVNVVGPGSVRTPRTLLRGTDSKKRAEKAKVGAPLGRICEPDEVASAVLFLLSDLASGITGQLLMVDAGRTAQTVAGGPTLAEVAKHRARLEYTSQPS